MPTKGRKKIGAEIRKEVRKQIAGHICLYIMWPSMANKKADADSLVPCSE